MPNKQHCLNSYNFEKSSMRKLFHGNVLFELCVPFVTKGYGNCCNLKNLVCIYFFHISCRSTGMLNAVFFFHRFVAFTAVVSLMRLCEGCSL